MYLYILFFLFFIGTNVCENLSKLSQQRIKHIIQHPGTTPEMRDKINHVLFDSYKGWAESKAIHFKRLHKHKCYHITPFNISNADFLGIKK
jgi:hypothetical protein